MEIFKFKPKSAEWLEKRSKYITATEVCSLFGMDKYKNASKLKKLKSGEDEFEDFKIEYEVGKDNRDGVKFYVYINSSTSNDLLVYVDNKLQEFEKDYTIQGKISLEKPDTCYIIFNLAVSIGSKVIIRTQAMKKGRLLEPLVFVHLTELGLDAKPVDYEHVVMAVDDENGLAASLDGKVQTETGFYLVEAKSTRPDLFEKWYDAPPIKYLMQVQTQLAVTNTTSAILACVDSSDILRFIAYEVTAHKETQDLIKKEAKRFWECFRSNKAFKVDSSIKDKIKSDVIQQVRLIFS